MACVDSPTFRKRTVCLVLFFGTFLLFSRAIGHGFLDYDDPDYVTNNAHVQAGLTWTSARWAFTSGMAANWFPLTWLSHMLDWQLFGNDPHGHHATNVFWHALNAVMAFLALRRLTGAFWTSAVSAALFAWHPLRVESVAWVAERKDVLSVFFGLLALWAYAVYAEKRRENRGRAGHFYALSLVAFAGGLLCKPMLVTMPCLLLLLDWWPLKRIGSAGKPAALLLEKAPFFLLTVASCLVTYQVQQAGNAVVESFGLGARLANAVVSVAGYLGKFFWPFNLAVGYPLPDRWPGIAVIGAVSLVVVITGLALWQRRPRPWLLTGWLWFLGMLVPVIGIVQVGMQAMADRYTYLPTLGLQIALLWTLREAAPLAARRWVPVAALAILAGLVFRTWNQLGVWRNSNTLYEHALAVTKDNYMAYSYLATTLMNEGRFAEASRYFGRAIEIKSDYAAARYRLGVALDKMGHTNEALATYTELLKIRPNYAAAHYGVGVILLSRNQPEAAIAHLQAALRKDPSHDSALVALGIATARLGHLQEAIADYEQALVCNPLNAEAYYNCANILVLLHRDQEASSRYEKALQLNPNLEEAQCNYANLLRKFERLDEACAHYRRAIQLQPNDANAHYGLGAALEDLGQTDEALATYTRAVTLKPDYTDAQYNVGVLLLNKNCPAEALVHFQAATSSQPDYTVAHVGTALAEEQLGRFPEAIASYERALRLDPSSADLADKLAQARHQEAASHPTKTKQ